MSKQLTERVDFDFIRYANCWEDADILVEALNVRPGDRVLSIASAGDNSFALLAQQPELVVAVDVNPVQLCLCELKKAAFTLESHDAFLRFLGFEKSSDRLAVYEQLKKQLSPGAQEWWDKHKTLIEEGVVTKGKFESYFAYFRKKILPFVHSQKDIEALFAPKTAEAQHDFYERKWNTWRWRLFFRVFFSRYIMGKYGRDPEFMKEVNVTVSKYIFGKAENHLVKKAAQENLYLHHIMTGTFAPRLPYYARKENFAAIQKNLDRFILCKGYAEDAIKTHGKFSVFNLSNIFEYLSAAVTRQVGEGLCNGATPGARFAYWNLMVPRKLSALLPEQLQCEETVSEAMTEKDNGFFYHRFMLELKK